MKRENERNGNRERPVAQIRLGNVHAAIWKKKGDKGSWFNVSFEKTYKGEDGVQSTKYFGRDELLAVAKVADLAHTRIFELQHEGREERKEREERGNDEGCYED